MLTVIDYGSDGNIYIPISLITLINIDDKLLNY